MADELYIVTNFDLKTKTGTPTRTRTTIEALAELTSIKVLSTSTFNSSTSDFTSKLDTLGRSRVRRLPIIYPVTQFLREPLVMFLLFLKLVRERPKKIYSVGLDAGFVAGVYRLLFGCRHILEIHALGKFSNFFYMPFCEWVAVKNLDSIVVPSKTMGNYLRQKYGLGEGALHLIYGPVDMPAKKKEKKSRGFTFGYGGNDAPYQGIETLLKACNLAMQKKSRLKFVFVGFDGAKYKGLLNEGIVVHGKTDDKTFRGILGGCDALLCGYRGEFAEYTYPHKVSMYLAFGKPVLSTSTGDLQEIIEGNNCGKTFPQDDYKRLAELMVSFSEKSREEISEMGRNAHDFAEQNLSMAAFKKKLRALIAE